MNIRAFAVGVSIVGGIIGTISVLPKVGRNIKAGAEAVGRWTKNTVVSTKDNVVGFTAGVRHALSAKKPREGVDPEIIAFVNVTMIRDEFIAELNSGTCSAAERKILRKQIKDLDATLAALSARVWDA